MLPHYPFNTGAATAGVAANNKPAHPLPTKTPTQHIHPARANGTALQDYQCLDTLLMSHQMNLSLVRTTSIDSNRNLRASKNLRVLADAHDTKQILSLAFHEGYPFRVNGDSWLS
jgi:hypothetical protein